MRRITLVGILVVAFTWCGMAFAFQNEPGGFRGLKWGDPPTEEMKFLQDFRETAIYENPSEEQKLGEAKFYSILYSFYLPPNIATKQFMTVALYFRGKENFGILETICKAKFGEPTREQYQEFWWSSLKSTVELTYDGIEETGYLSLSSGPIFDRYMEERKKQQAESAEKDW